MQIEYIISNSPNKGKGVYTTQFIPQYSIIWNFNMANIKLYNETAIKKIIYESNNIDLLNYGYFTLDNIFVDIREDDGKYFNHSNNPNIALGSVLINKNIPGDFHPNSSYALRNIEITEELFDNYNSFGKMPEWYENIVNTKINCDYM